MTWVGIESTQLACQTIRGRVNMTKRRDLLKVVGASTVGLQTSIDSAVADDHQQSGEHGFGYNLRVSNYDDVERSLAVEISLKELPNGKTVDNRTVFSKEYTLNPNGADGGEYHKTEALSFGVAGIFEVTAQLDNGQEATISEWRVPLSHVPDNRALRFMIGSEGDIRASPMIR